MSAPSDSATDPLAYAPKWARDSAIAERRNAARQDRVSKSNDEVLFGSAVAEAPDDAWLTVSQAQSLDPIVMPPPPPRSLLRVVGRLSIAATAGAIMALFLVGKLPSWGPVAKGDRLHTASFETRFIGQKDQTSNLDSYVAQLVHINIARQRENEDPRLAQPLAGTTEDQPSSRATDGASRSAAVNDEPRLAQPLAATTADQPSSHTTEGASHSAPVNDETRVAQPLGGTIADQPSSRTTDGASRGAPVNDEPRLTNVLRGTTAEYATEPTSPTPRAPNPDDIAAFLNRGLELISSGDIAAARVLLLRAAEVRDPNAALALASSFDPILLERLGAYGVVPDVSSARRWYEKAKEFGSEEASSRLEMLARRGM